MSHKKPDDEEDDSNHGPHGPGCNCHRSTESIRRELIQSLANADAFAVVAVGEELDGVGVTAGRAFVDDLDDEALVDFNKVIDMELQKLIPSESPVSGGTRSPISEALQESLAGATVMSGEKFFDILSDDAGDDDSTSAEDVQNEHDEFDGTEIDVE